MRNRKAEERYFNKLKILLIILSIFAAVKMLFFAFGLDEEYQLVMAYRNVRGDRLFLTMWEPHQTSAFLCALLMRPYLAVFGTTGIVIWLRFCGTLIHLGVSFYLYKVLRGIVSEDSAFLLGLIYFNTIPKQIMLPEFGIMQVWFLTLLSLFLIRYYGGGEGGKDTGVGGGKDSCDFCTDNREVKYDNGVIDRKNGDDAGAGSRKYLIFVSFALVLEVLSYPSCALLYVLVLWIIWRRSGKRRFADMSIVTGVCGLCGVVYLGLLLRNNTLEGLVGTLSHIVNGDITHSLTFTDKLFALGRDVLLPAALCLGVFLLAKAGAYLTARIFRRRKALERVQGTASGARTAGADESEKETEEEEKTEGSAALGRVEAERELEAAEGAEETEESAVQGRKEAECELEAAEGAEETETSAASGTAEREREAVEKWMPALRVIWAAGLSCLMEIWYWVMFNAGYESMQVHLIVFAAFGVMYYAHCYRKCNEKYKKFSKKYNIKFSEKYGGKIGKFGEQTFSALDAKTKRRDERGKQGNREKPEGIDKKDSGIYQGRAADRSRLLEGLLLDGIILAGGALLAVLYLTDLGLMDSLPHAMTAAIFGMALVVMYWEGASRAKETVWISVEGEKAERPADRSAEGEKARKSVDCCAGGEKAVKLVDGGVEGEETKKPLGRSAEGEETEKSADRRTGGERIEKRLASGEGQDMAGRTFSGRRSGILCIHIALLFWAFTAVFGKGYTLRSGTGYHNVLQSGGILKYGPAAGTISDYMCAYIYNCDYEDWQGRIQDGDRVLIMVDQVMNLGTIQYLFKDVEISHYSIVNPTAYDGRLMDYWEMFPEKAPNVIIVDDWYGQLMTDPDGWLMRYVEGKFGYESMEEGRYIRIYRKEQDSPVL